MLKKYITIFSNMHSKHFETISEAEGMCRNKKQRATCLPTNNAIFLNLSESFKLLYGNNINEYKKRQQLNLFLIPTNEVKKFKVIFC